VSRKSSTPLAFLLLCSIAAGGAVLFGITIHSIIALTASHVAFSTANELELFKLGTEPLSDGKVGGSNLEWGRAQYLCRKAPSFDRASNSMRKTESIVNKVNREHVASHSDDSSRGEMAYG
jgi:hypothetical protein